MIFASHSGGVPWGLLGAHLPRALAAGLAPALSAAIRARNDTSPPAASIALSVSYALSDVAMTRKSLSRIKSIALLNAPPLPFCHVPQLLGRDARFGLAVAFEHAASAGASCSGGAAAVPPSTFDTLSELLTPNTPLRAHVSRAWAAFRGPLPTPLMTWKSAFGGNMQAGLLAVSAAVTVSTPYHKPERGLG